ncbi:MAG TPA: DHH family phosphoesterase [Patescibacteria group bacterium]|nr:DHH family phosphoesterase [Patescibacteria group bacterium]
MALPPEQQAIELISRAKSILVLGKENPSTDTISSVVGLGLLLQKLNKTFDLVLPQWDPKQYPSFLPTVPVQAELGPMRTFHLSVNVEQVPLSELMYDVRNNKLEITLIPKQGEWSPSDVTFSPGEDRYDLVIALDCPDVHVLGDGVRRYADFLYRATAINIDHHATNEFWGQLNLVDLNASSTTEVLYHWLASWNKAMIDESLATSLLSGILAETKGFRTNRISPRTLLAAADLVSLGADREKITQGLWRTRSISTLRLWGRALSRLNQDETLGLVWTTLTQNDLIESNTSTETLAGAVDELVSFAPEARVSVFMVQQKPDELTVMIFTQPPLSALDLVRPFSGSGSQERASCIVPIDNLVQGTKKIMDQIRTILRAASA